MLNTKNARFNIAKYAFFVSLILLNGCASQRISGALQRYGLDEKRSECVGDRLAETMSSQELQSLIRAARAYKQATQSLKISDFKAVGHEQDAKTPVKITQAALQCGLASSDVLLIPFIRD